jgi:hypothetical protein
MRRTTYGYVVWGIVAVMIGVPELWSNSDASLPFVTISETVGSGLERFHPWVSLVVVALVVFAAYFQFRPLSRYHLTSGRLTLKPPRQGISPESQGLNYVDTVGLAGAAYLLIAVAVTAAATWVTVELSPESYHPSFVLYGLIATFAVILPSLLALVAGRDAPFPTLFATVKNIEERLGPVWGSFFAAAVLAGLVILLLHIVLYQWPDVTHILNPNGG